MFRNKIEISSGKSENTRPIIRHFWRFITLKQWIIQGKNWNGLKEENCLSPNVSVVSKQNWNKLWKRWKYQAPFLAFQNTETMDYIGKKLKRTETRRKLTFETKLKQVSLKRTHTSTSHVPLRPLYPYIHPYPHPHLIVPLTSTSHVPMHQISCTLTSTSHVPLHPHLIYPYIHI